MPELTGTKDLRTYLRIVWRWKYLVLVFLVAAPVISYLVAKSSPKLYSSSTLVGINGTTVGGSGLGGGGSFSTTNVQAIAELVTTSPVADVAARLMHPPADPSQIAGEVTATGDTTTNFLTIKAQDANPQRAGQIANAFARAITLNTQAAALAQINKGITTIQRRLRHLTNKDATLKTELEQQLAQLQASLTTQGSAAAILQPAGPGALAGTSARRAVEIGLVIGLLLAFGAIAVAENADRRLRTPADLEAMAGVPLLAAIAPSAFSRNLDTTEEDAEAFHMLRTALMYFNVERPIKSVVITSAGEKDGKTTIATRLALNTAAADKRVILVDADLRRAQVSAKFGITQKVGLGAVLAGEASLSDVLVDFPIEHTGDGELKVLPAGQPPPNPSALLSSHRMEEVLRELESECDLVILDTPAALAVSDPLPLMRLVSGVVLVARMNRSSRDTLRRLQQMVHSAHGKLLGAVATGVSAGPGYEHYYPKYYSHKGSNGSGSARRIRRPLSRNAGQAGVKLADDE